MNLPAEVSAVLCRFKIPIAQTNEMTAGMTFPVPKDAFDTVEVTGIGGRKLCIGALGQVDGRRAVMLQAARKPEADESFDTAAHDRKAPGVFDPQEMSEAVEAALEMPMETKSTVQDLPELPELAQLPELSDLPQIDDDAQPDKMTETSDPPDLPDIPDFDDPMTDMGDLPKLNIA